MRNLAEINGVGEALAAAFVEKGYHSVQDIAEATEAKLATVPGISRVRAAQLISSAQLLLNDPSPSKTIPSANVTDEEKTPVEPVQKPHKDASFTTASPASNTGVDRPTVDPAQASGNGKLQSNPPSSASVTDEEKTPVEPVLAAREDASSETASLVGPAGQSKKMKKGDKKKDAKSKVDKKKTKAKEKKDKSKKSLKDKKNEKNKKREKQKKIKKNQKKKSKEKSGKKKSGSGKKK